MKCNFTDCNKKASNILDCNLCNKNHCSLHRLPEEHQCINLQIYSNILKSKNQLSLIQNKTDTNKLEKID